MSNTESFVDEVNEDLRRDRLFALMRRYGWIAVLAVLLIVGGATYREWRVAQDRAAAQAQGGILLDATKSGDPAAQAAALEGQPGVLAVLLRAAGLLEADQPQAAAAELSAYAATAEDRLYGDLAALKAAMIAHEGTTPEARRAALEPLAVPGAPYRLLAAEQIALIDLQTGDNDEAIAALRAILEDAEMTPELERRASSLLTALGEEPTPTN